MRSFLFFIKMLTNYKRELIIGILLSLALAFSSIALLTLSGWFISAAAFAGLAATSAIVFNYFIPASMIRLLAFIRILSRYGDRVINHDVTFRILSRLRVWFYEKLIPLAPAHLLSHRSGDLLNRIVNDIDTLDHLYLNVLSPFIVAFFLLISITFFTAFFTIQLAMIVFIMMIAALIIIPVIVFPQSKKIGDHIQLITAQLRTQTIDLLQGFVDLLLFVKKENRLTLVDTEYYRLIAAQKRMAMLKGFTISAMQLSSGITVFLVLFCGIPLVRNHTINGAELAMIVLLVIAAFEQLLSIPFAFLSLGKTQAAANRLLEIANAKPTVIFSVDQHPQQFDIVFVGVSFAYPNSPIPIINNKNTTIPFGSHLCIAGDSGIGKTTFAQLIARIWDPTAGKITIGGVDLKNLSEKTLRETVSYVTQQVHIFNASIRHNLTLFNDNYSDDELYSILEKVELVDLVKDLPEKLDTQMGEFGKNFSGGQIRRISIARALLQNTPILILDEPTTGLEEALVQRILKKCEDDFKNKTVIVITHHQDQLVGFTHWKFDQR